MRKIACAIFLIGIIFSPISRTPQAAPTALDVERATREDAFVPPETWIKAYNEAKEGFAQRYGTRFAVLFNYAQQAIVHSRHDQGKIRNLWYWDLEVMQDLWPGADLVMDLEVDKGKGVDKFLPTFSIFNTNSGADASLYIPDLYLEQKACADKLFLATGKVDLSNWFDVNEVANSGDTQFLSSALINNQAIPFPAKGLGAMINFKPCAWLYLQSGAATARAQYTKTGLSDGFNSTFFINELGLAPKFKGLQGNYRFIFYLNHEKVELINQEGTKNDDAGFGVSFDQAVTRRITLFLRYGLADEKVRDIEYFWSCGVQITGPLPGRKSDCLGLGVARSILSDDYRTFNDPDISRAETIYEAYYSYSVNDMLALTPNIQVVTDPSGDKTEGTYVVCGLRCLLSF